MTDQPTLFEARAERDRAMAQVERNAGETWNDYADRFIADYARKNEFVFCDDLWAAGLELPPNTTKALGPRIAAARRAGLIAFADAYRPSVTSHGIAKKVWRSRLWLNGPYGPGGRFYAPN